ncbi:MAG: phosphatidate cytidylyltransferase [Halofilum sp. (in: g-proteobacteria)]|nr:phosphatidate cytidylyltransferase [Halofilum sp. (in: g-proteobacteria)]
MLKLRVITGVTLALLVVAGALTLDQRQLAVLATAVALLAAWEWTRLAGLVQPAARAAGLAAVAAAHGLLWWPGVAPSGAVLLPLVAVFWVAFATWLVAGGRPRSGVGGVRWRWLVAGLVLLPAFSLGLLTVAAAPPGRGLLLYALFLVFVADTGAYFSGRRFGRRKLAPAVSGGKTWEGLFGGLVCVAAFTVVAAWLLEVPPARWPLWVGIGLLAGALSVAGDLFISVLKREAGAKDSGRLLPGHGGLLDRMDSLLAAVPVQAVGFGLVLGTGGP